MNAFGKFLLTSAMNNELRQAAEFAAKNGCKILDNPTGIGYLVGVDEDEQQLYAVDSIKEIYDTVTWLIRDKTEN